MNSYLRSYRVFEFGLIHKYWLWNTLYTSMLLLYLLSFKIVMFNHYTDLVIQNGPQFTFNEKMLRTSGLDTSTVWIWTGVSGVDTAHNWIVIKWQIRLRSKWNNLSKHSFRGIKHYDTTYFYTIYIKTLRKCFFLLQKFPQQVKNYPQYQSKPFRSCGKIRSHMLILELY